MSIHREGYASIATVSIALLAFNILLVLLMGANVLAITIPLSLVAVGFFVQFFRNPQRTTPISPDAVISPADGTVVAIERVIENEYFKDERLKISIYMSA